MSTARDPSRSDETRAAFETVWHQLDLAAVARDVATDATLTPRALLALRAAALSEPSLATDATLAVPAPAPPAEAPLPTLPRLAVDLAQPDVFTPEDDPLARPDLEVRGVLGEGGMGRVLLARQRSLDRDVAIKIVRPAVHDAATVGALLREARITGHLEHPSVIPVHALGRDAHDRPLLVMKRVEGASWRAMLHDPEHPAWSRLGAGRADRVLANVEVMTAVCNAVHFAHSRGYVHRDLKPENVMIGDFGEVYLLDWGIAVRVAPGGTAAADGAGLAGTPAYMAPEMVSAAAGAIDARTDVYLLGATLHEALVGTARHAGESLYEVLLNAFESRPYDYPAHVPPELAALCNRATSPRHADRFPSALALRGALQDFLRHRGSNALAAEGAARLEEARAPGATRVLQRLSEARFAFAQALREWRENAAARAGLQACLERMVVHELDHENADGAAALLAELPTASPALAARLAALVDRIAERRAREARLARLEEERDVRTGARGRSLVVAVLTVCALAIAGYVAVFQARGAAAREFDPRTVAKISAALVATYALTLGALRRHVLKTAINRGLAGLMGVWLVAMLANRLVALRLGVPAPTTLTGDLLLGAALAAVGGITVLPWIGWIAVGFAAGAAGSAWMPGTSPVWISVCSIAAIVYVPWMLRRDARRADAARAERVETPRS